MDTSAPQRIPYVNLGAQFAEEKAEIMQAVEAVLSSGAYIGGGDVEAFERETAAYIGTKHCVALNSGTDALWFAMVALGIEKGDEVITPPNSFVASTATIVHAGATPVFADVLPDQNIDPAEVEKKITPRTKAIMAVHLSGRVCRMHALRALARKHGLYLIEDSAQSAGSMLDNEQTGAMGDVGCFSAHPLKNLNGCGDAGFITTNNDAVAEKVKLLRNHGLVDRNSVALWGYVSRLDSIQAAILRVRLKNLQSVIERRRRNAELYRRILDPEVVFAPPCEVGQFNTFHTFVVQVDRRDELQKYLASRGIGTAIHYPIPIHLQDAAAGLGHKRGDFPVTEKQAGRILTLPVNQFMREEDIVRVATEVNGFLRG